MTASGAILGKAELKSVKKRESGEDHMLKSTSMKHQGENTSSVNTEYL